MQAEEHTAAATGSRWGDAAAAPSDEAGREARLVARAYEAVESEVDVRLEPAEGAVPEALRGVLYRNGPGRLGIGGDRYGHPFDGDGHVVRFALGPDGVRYRNRFVRTRELEAEERAGRMLYRGFGSNLPGGLGRNLLRVRFKNAANTHVVWHGGSLLALWEGGVPHRLDPETLATLGRYDYRGRLRAGGLLERVLTPELPFAAHPTVDPRTGELWSFGTLLGARPRLLLYRVDPAGHMAPIESVPLDRLYFLHDFVLTRRWRVFFLTPVSFDVARALSGLDTPVDAIHQTDGAPTRVCLVPRDGGPPRFADADPCFVFHFAGGFDADDGRVVVDGLRMDGFPGGSVDLSDPEALAGLRYPPPRLTRFTIDPVAGTVDEARLFDRPGELPSVHPDRVTRRHRFVWATAKAHGTALPVYRSLVKWDVETRQERVRDFGWGLPGEPLMVPRPGATAEDDGWLLCLAYHLDDHRSSLHVLDAATLEPVARLPLPHHVPPGFHGTWVPTD